MRINHEVPLPEGRELDFRILLEPGQPPVRVKSQVSWQKENAFGHFLIGLQFTEVTDQAKERIETYIRSTAKKSRGDGGPPGGGGGLSSFLPNA